MQFLIRINTKNWEINSDYENLIEKSHFFTVYFLWAI